VAKSSLFPGRDPLGRLSVLYLTNQLPFPAHSGGQLREAQLLARLAEAVDVRLGVLTGHYDRDLEHAELALPHCSELSLFESVPVPSEGPPDDVPERVWAYHSAAFRDWLRPRLRATEVDVVHVEGYFLARQLPGQGAVPLVVVEENIEYVLDREREAAGHRRGARWPVSRALEHDVWSAATLVGAVSDHDAGVIRRDCPRARVVLTPNGCDHLPGPEPRVHTGIGTRVAFVGNYGWAPTRDGAWELVRRIWPRIRRAMPEARLTLAGADMPGDLAAAAGAVAGIDVVGEVSSVLPTLAGADVFVCPIRTGSGVKVKMVEAMHAGCAIVCTSAATRGLPEGAGSAVVVADDEHEFADAVVALLGDAGRRSVLSSRAVDLIQGLPTWDQAAKILLGHWQRAAAQRVTGALSSGRSGPGLVTGAGSGTPPR
jgi:glycosyltransferase involved in cell wall biosynthesis